MPAATLELREAREGWGTAAAATGQGTTAAGGTWKVKLEKDGGRVHLLMLLGRGTAAGGAILVQRPAATRGEDQVIWHSGGSVQCVEGPACMREWCCYTPHPPRSSA